MFINLEGGLGGLEAQEQEVLHFSEQSYEQRIEIHIQQRVAVLGISLRSQEGILQLRLRRLLDLGAPGLDLFSLKI